MLVNTLTRRTTPFTTTPSPTTTPEPTNLTPAQIIYRPLDDGVNPLAHIQVPAYSKPAFIDINGDGALDLVVGASDGFIRQYLNISKTFSKEILLDTKCSNFSAPAAVDLDGDGIKDLVIGDLTGQLHLFKMDPASRSFLPMHASIPANQTSSLRESIFKLKSSGSRSAPAFYDIDGDGYLEF